MRNSVTRLAASGRGQVIVTSSITGPITGYPGWTHYGASKAGLHAFGQSLAVALAPHAITVASVAPGYVATDMTADELATEGISVEVIDLRSLSPLDRDTVIESAARTGRAAVVHGATTFCGPGAEIAALLQEELHGRLSAPVRRLGAPYAPIPFATELEVFPTSPRIRDELRAMVRGRPDG